MTGNGTGSGSGTGTGSGTGAGTGTGTGTGSHRPGADGLPPGHRIPAVLALSLLVSVTVLVGSLVNVALPQMARELGSSDAAIVWVVSAYQLTVTVMLLPLAALGERRGFKGVFLAGAALFAAASLAAAFVHGLPGLLTLRALQGVGAAAIMGANTALLRACYPGAQLGRGIGINGMVVAASAAAGPTVAGVLLGFGAWPWLFVLQAVVAAAGLLLAWRWVPRLPASGSGFDHLGALLQAAVLTLVLAAVEQSHRGGAIMAAAVFAAALLVGIVFVRFELKHPHPVLPLDLLRQPAVALSLLSAIGAFVAQMAAQVALPFHLHRLLGGSAQRIGLLMTPWPLAVMVVAPLAGALSDRVPAGLLGGVGLVTSAAALALLAALPAGTTDVAVVWRMALAGIGFALFTAPNVRSVVAAAPAARSGAAGSLIAIARLVGQTGGASLVAWLLGMALVRPGAAWAPAQASLALAAAVSLAAAALSLSRLRQK